MALKKTTGILLLLSSFSYGVFAETGSPDVRGIHAVMTGFDTAIAPATSTGSWRRWPPLTM